MGIREASALRWSKHEVTARARQFLCVLASSLLGAEKLFLHPRIVLTLFPGQALKLLRLQDVVAHKISAQPLLLRMLEIQKNPYLK